MGDYVAVCQHMCCAWLVSYGEWPREVNIQMASLVSVYISLELEPDKHLHSFHCQCSLLWVNHKLRINVVVLYNFCH